MVRSEKALLLIPMDKDKGYKHIVSACEHLNVSYTLYDIYSSDWVSEARRLNVTGCIYRPDFRYGTWREVFRERIRTLNEQLGIPVYPQTHELDLYESKRRMAAWLQANSVPSPNTYVFCRKDDALGFIGRVNFPLVFKTDFGNAGTGVRIIFGKNEATRIVNQVFSNGYIIPSYNPKSLDLWRRAKHFARPFYKRLTEGRHFPPDRELDVVIFQDFVDIAREWRVIRIGDRFFGHDKLPDERGLRSGRGDTSWLVPAAHVFDFAKQVCELGGFRSMALDLFEDKQGQLFVNELQTVFGVIAKNQMYRVLGEKKEPFAFIYDVTAKDWKSEEGEFGQDYCYRLRVQDFLKQARGMQAVHDGSLAGAVD